MSDDPTGTPKAVQQYLDNLAERGPQQASSPKSSNSTKALTRFDLEFAEWLAAQPEHVPVDDQIEKAQEIYQRVFDRRKLRALRTRVEFKKYFAMLVEDNLAAARARLENTMIDYVKADHEGLDMALKAGDYRAIPQYTTKAFDRVWPKRDDQPIVQAVQINLTAKQQELLTSDAPEIEVEMLDD